MRVLVIGNGAREHAIAWRLAAGQPKVEVFAAPGNPGVARLGNCVPIEGSNIIELADFAQELNIGLTVVGPELPLTLGIADEFHKRGLTIFGPSAAAAEIEGSKVYAKRFMRTHGIPTADFEVASSQEEAEAVLERRGGRVPVVIKADGLAGGKGVVIAGTVEEARLAIERMMVGRVHGKAGERLVIEDHLLGGELSFQVVTDGRHLVALSPARDYKRLLDDDEGPNTGGMGSVSPSKVPRELGHQILESIVRPTISGLEKEGRRFVGVLFFGLMLTDRGPYVLEFNARFGDPETQSVLPRLDSDFVELLRLAAEGKLDGHKVEWKKEVSVSVVLAAHGYPGAVRAGDAITGIEEAERIPGVRIFHAGTALQDGKLVTAAGRVLTVNATAPSRARAVELAYKACGLIQFADMQYRRDIGRVAEGEGGVV